MKWWYKEGENTYDETFDCFEDLAFSICSLKKNTLYEHDVENIYIFNDDKLFLICKASELDPLTIHTHRWSEEQIQYSQNFEFSRIEEDRMLYLTRVVYEKEWKSEEEIMEIKEKLNEINEHISSGFEDKMCLKEYKCVYDLGRNVTLKLENIRIINKRKFNSFRVISQLMRSEYELQSEMEENAYVLAFDSAMKAVGILHLSRGNDDECEMDTRIIFRFLLLVGAVQFVVIHNHPNGLVDLTQNDFEVTSQIRLASLFFNIKFLEHIIICNDIDTYGLEVVQEMLENNMDDVNEYYS